jgi:hypothetical protein
MAVNPDLPARCEDFPCCEHDDGSGLPCNWIPPDYASDPHLMCDHENGVCEIEPDDEEDEESSVIFFIPLSERTDTC